MSEILTTARLAEITNAAGGPISYQQAFSLFLTHDATLRLALAEAQHEAETLKTERNAALTLAEQRGAAYDMAWREVESLREWKDKEEEERGRQYGLRVEAEQATEQAWADVLSALRVAFGEDRPYDESPTELIVQLADERDEARAERDRAATIATQEAVGHSRALTALSRARETEDGAVREGYFDVVFDGPPEHVSGRFVEVENERGASISIGAWIHRPDGYWALRIQRSALSSPPRPAPPTSDFHTSCDWCKRDIPNACYAVLCSDCDRRGNTALFAPPADAATEGVEDDSPFAVADSVEEGRALGHCSPADLPAATYLKGLVYRLVGAYDRVEMRRRALWKSHGKLLIQQKVAEKLRPRPSAEWHEDFGEALWFVLPIREAPYCGSPLADDWPFGEDGDDEGATWPTLTEDQTLVWVPVEPIARLVNALSTPAPAPSAKEGRT